MTSDKQQKPQLEDKELQKFLENNFSNIKSTIVYQNETIQSNRSRNNFLRGTGLVLLLGGLTAWGVYSNRDQASATRDAIGVATDSINYNLNENVVPAISDVETNLGAKYDSGKNEILDNQKSLYESTSEQLGELSEQMTIVDENVRVIGTQSGLENKLVKPVEVDSITLETDTTNVVPNPTYSPKTKYVKPGKYEIKKLDPIVEQMRKNANYSCDCIKNKNN